MENIPEVVRTTATNVYELLLQLAAHIEKLEKDIVSLKAAIEANTDDFK